VVRNHLEVGLSVQKLGEALPKECVIVQQ
jgi:hypothetical protein